MERETRIELATPTLARLCSTAELFPHTKYLLWRLLAESNRRRWICNPLHNRFAKQPFILIEKNKKAAIFCGFKNSWSGKRGSNSRPQPWQGCALPLSYSRSVRIDYYKAFSFHVNTLLQIYFKFVFSVQPFTPWRQSPVSSCISTCTNNCLVPKAS